MKYFLHLKIEKKKENKIHNFQHMNLSISQKNLNPVAGSGYKKSSRYMST